MQMKLKQHLKTTTKPLHEWLESSETFCKLKNNELTKEEYSELLKILYTFVYSLEEELKQHVVQFKQTGLDDIENRLEKTDWLKKDFELLDVKIENFEKVEFKSLDSFDSAVGALYVIEGSTMGGMQIVKIIKDKLPTNYYQSYSDKTMPMWMNFATWLDESKISEYEVSLGASEAFILLKKLIDLK